MIDAILQIQEGRIPTKRRLRKASTVNREGRKLGVRERKKPKKLKRRRKGGRLGTATPFCRFYKVDQVDGPHTFTFRYHGRGATQRGLKSSARRTHRAFESERHVFLRWVSVSLL